VSKSSQITLADIARELQVSKVTISKALRDHPDISSATKERVREVAKKLGYFPNYFARNLSSKKSGAIGVLVPKLTHHFFSTVIESIYDTALEHNYEVILMVSQEDSQRETLHLQTLISMRVDGLLISLSKMTPDLSIFKEIEKLSIPTVFFDRVLNQLDFSTVTTDDINGAYLLVKHAIGQGFRKIAHLAGYSHTNIGKARRQGYEEALHDHGIELPEEWIIEGGFAEKDGKEGFRKLMRSGNLPEMIFTVTYPVALGVISAAKAANLQIPEKLDLVCFGGSDYNKCVYPSITCVEQPAKDLGNQATKLLLHQIMQGESNSDKHLVLPTRLYQGDTCQSKIKT
jgi:LacI family transcriptional regulator